MFTHAAVLTANLLQAHRQGRLQERISDYGKPKLLIIDELGYLPFDPESAHLFSQLVSRRYERGSNLLRATGRSASERG